MDLIVVGGSSRHFYYLKTFASSLREKAKFKGEVVLCDNYIFKHKRKIKYCKDLVFSQEQRNYLNRYDIRIIELHDLLTKNNISLRPIHKIPTQHAAYPFKWVYTSLITKEYLNKCEKVCHFDSDFYFQGNLDQIFNSFKDDSIYMTPERLSMGSNRIVRKWIDLCDISFGTSRDLYLKEMLESKNFCSGFFGGRIDRINRFSLFCWIFATNNLIRFHNDQPLVNILTSFFGYKIEELSNNTVVHLWDAEKEEVNYDRKQDRILYKGVAPAAVHFNAGSYPEEFGKVHYGSEPEKSKASKPRFPWCWLLKKY